MITIEKHKQAIEIVKNTLHLLKVSSKQLRIEKKFESQLRVVFNKQEKEFWRLEKRGRWLEKCYIKAQQDLSKIKKMGISDNPTERIGFISKMTKEWRNSIDNDNNLEEVIYSNYKEGYNLGGQKVLTEFAIQANFNLRALNVLDALGKKAHLVGKEINDVSWDLLNNKIADSFWKEGNGIEQVTADIKGMYKETYYHRGRNIARTETGYAVSEASYQSYKKANVPMLEWIAEIDACKLCSPLRGQKVKTGEYFDNGLGWRGKRPLVHPSCKCDIVGYVSDDFIPSKYWDGK